MGVKDDLNVSEVFQHLGIEFVKGGGEATFGAGGITSIEDVASKPIADRAGNKASGTANATAGQPATAAEGDANPAFKLGSGQKSPLVQRTGGKKSRLPHGCHIL